MIFSRNRLLVLSLVGAVFLCGACKGYNESDDSHAKAVAIWRRHEASIARAVSGVVVNDEFEEACRFFEKVVGIEVRGDGSYIGWIPNEGTREDLGKIREWYKRNEAQLYWDSTEGEVRVRK